MNKNLFLGMFVAAGTLFATSCSNDELEAVRSGNEAQVSFSLGLEGGLDTRAISDGTGAKKLICAIYDANDPENKVLLDKVVINDEKVDENGQYVNTDAFKGGLKDKVEITLAKGQTYTMVFWAQNPACDAYNTDDLTAVEVDYTNGEEGTAAAGDINNDETRDAFYAAETFEVKGDKEINVTLKRPFAQINVGVDKEDWDAAVASGITIKESSVVIKDVADKINLLTGAVEASEAMEDGITYTLNTIPNETLYVETDETKEGKEAYVWLSMSYVLVNDGSASAPSVDGTNQSTLSALKYTFAPTSGKQIVFEEGLAGAPVQRNYRTNILGKILTGDIQFNITIDPAYDGDFIYPSKLEEELEFAATFGGTVTLTDNVTLTKALNVKADMVINLGDYTISNANDYAIENTGNLTINAENGGISGMGGIRSKGGKITINGGTYTGSSDWNDGTYQHMLKAENTEVVINGGTFDATIGGITNAMINVSNGSKVTINGGEFRNVSDGTDIPNFAPYMFTYEGDGKLIINDGEFYGGWRFNGETATTDIYGGNFTVSYDGQSFNANSTHVLTVYGGTFSVNNGGKLDPTNYVVSGYTAINNGEGIYNIYAIDAAKRTITINSVSEFLNLHKLHENWVDLFSNGQGSTFTDFAVEHGGKGTDFYYKWGWTIKLNADIDLENSTIEPINIGGWGTFDGQNHIIKNVKIATATDVQTEAGLFNAGNCALKNFVLDNIHVTGSFVENSTAGIFASSCNAAGGVDNITITNSSVTGGKYTGGVVGYGYTSVTNCKLTDCVVKGGYKLGGVIGYICSSSGDKAVDGHTLIGCTVNGADGQYAGGKDKYIVGRIVGNYNCNGTCKNNTVVNMTTSAKADIGEIEANLSVTGQAAIVSVQDDLAAALSDPSVETIHLGAGDYEANLGVANSRTLTIIGTEETEIQFENQGGQNSLPLNKFDNLTIRNCKIGKMLTKNWGMLVFGSSNNANGVYTIENCTFEGVNTQGIYINETASGATYNILNCTFSGDFGSEGAITIQNNTNINHNVNVKGCTFNNVTDGHKIYILGNYTGWTLNTDLDSSDVNWSGANPNI